MTTYIDPSITENHLTPVTLFLGSGGHYHPLSQVTSDFVSMAIKGAQAVVDGNIPPLNGADDRKSRMYLWNNIFFR